jgi:hypothetical protein
MRLAIETRPTRPPIRLRSRRHPMMVIDWIGHSSQTPRAQRIRPTLQDSTNRARFTREDIGSPSCNYLEEFFCIRN